MNQACELWSITFLSLLWSIGYTLSVHHFCTSHFTCINRRKPMLFLLIISLPISDAVIISGILSYPVWLLCPLLRQILLILCIVLLYQGSAVQKILASSLLLAVSSLLQDFAASLFMCLMLIILHAAHIEHTPLLNYMLDCTAYCIAAACTIGGTIVLARHMAGFFANRLRRWYIMLCVPLFGIIILWDLIYIGACHGILLRGGDYLNSYYNELFSQAGICILSLLCMCGVGFYLFGMDKIDIEQKQKEQYHSQVVFYQMLEEQYRSLECLRHDMKNHIIGLQQIIDSCEGNNKSNNPDCGIAPMKCRVSLQIRDYLYRLADTGGIGHADDLTGKSVVDALLYYKHNQAKNHLIRWECDVHIPSECPIADFDLCVIFGNLLDNALEACQKIETESNRFINIQASMVKKCLLIEITNSTAEHPGCYKDGIGLRNVKDSIDKYNGTLNINTDDTIFRVSVLLPCILATHDTNPSL